MPPPQSHTETSWLFSGEHPQAPIVQVFGKSLAEPQQSRVTTVPPDSAQSCSGVPVPVWREAMHPLPATSKTSSKGRTNFTFMTIIAKPAFKERAFVRGKTERRL
jgi:hypothetical protein